MKELSQQEVIKQYDKLVHRIAHQSISRLPPSIELDDLIQVGRMGLLEAHKNYIPCETKFEIYSAQRVRGAILDYLREMDWLSRDTRQKIKRVEKAVQILENKVGRNPTAQEIANELGVTLSDYFSMAAYKSTVILSLAQDDEQDEAANTIRSEAIKDPNDPNPERILLEHEREKLLEIALRAFPERERKIIHLLVDREYSLREVGVIFGVTESRICQIYGQAVIKCQKFIQRHGAAEKITARPEPEVLALPDDMKNCSGNRFTLPRNFRISGSNSFNPPANLSTSIQEKKLQVMAKQHIAVTSNHTHDNSDAASKFSPLFRLPTTFAIVSAISLIIDEDLSCTLMSKLKREDASLLDSSNVKTDIEANGLVNKDLSSLQSLRINSAIEVIVPDNLEDMIALHSLNKPLSHNFF